MHLLRGLRRDQTVQCLPELRRRLCLAADQAGTVRLDETGGEVADRLASPRSDVGLVDAAVLAAELLAEGFAASSRAVGGAASGAGFALGDGMSVTVVLSSDGAES